MEAVEEAVYKDFEKWSKEEGNSDKSISVFMEEVYAMKVGKGNIFEKIKAMTLPPISSKSKSSSALLENIATCRANNKSTTSTRSKRDTSRTTGCSHQSSDGLDYFG